jgi:hypothetical protein
MGEPTRAPTVSESLRAAIIEDGRPLRELARQCGVDEPRLSRFASGKRLLSLPAVDAVASALGLRLVKPGREKGGR